MTEPTTDTKYYQQSVEDTARQLGVDISRGLAAAEVTKRTQEFGPNELQVKSGTSPLKLFLSQFTDVLILVLLAAASVSLGISLYESREAPVEALLIYGIVLAIAVIGFLNEYKAERTVAALRKLVSFNARVLRDGREVQVTAAELVPGDILVLEEGQKIPADARLFEANALRVNEASLTGESEPQGKNTQSFPQKKLALGDQKNMIFSGTVVTTGTGRAIVVATGSQAEIGRIATLVGEVQDQRTPMQKKLDALGKRLGLVVGVICAVAFAAIFFLDRGHQQDETVERVAFAFTAAVALAVAAIPEGLAFVVRICLALGARRMAARNALVRRLSAVESLGSTDVICTDKTGTLTRGEMTVRAIAAGPEYEVTGEGYAQKGELLLEGKTTTPSDDVAWVLKIGALCNNAKIDGQKLLGDPTELSLIVAARKFNVPAVEKRVFEMPFTSERKMMATVHEVDERWLVAVKGAPEVVLQHCTHVRENGKVTPLSEVKRREIHARIATMTSQALRVLALAYKEEATLPVEAHIEEKLVLAGLVGIMDPPRLEVKEVITRVQQEAGMRVVMITGDNAATAQAVGREIGIGGDVITGLELDDLDQATFERRVEEIGIYARVNPEHKIRIVEALQKRGHQVAMTGDGVNDAPALKAANIGVAMGITGTDASKEASDLILLDDQFLTIIAAIEEGRGIFDNMRKFVNFLLSTNIAEVCVVLLGILIHGNLLLTAAQILFINIVTDGLPAIALGSDTVAKGVMRRKPSEFQQDIVNRRTWLEIIVFGVVMSAVVLVHYEWVLSSAGTLIASSVVFASIIVYTFTRLVDIRSDYRLPFFSNPWLLFSLAGSLLVTLGVFYIRPLADLFDVHPLAGRDWLIIAGGSLLLIVIMKLLNKPLNMLARQRE